MNRLRACLLSSALLSASSAQALGLLDAYQLAVRHDPTFQAALHERRAGSENRAIGRAGLLPSLRYDYNKARNDSTVSQGDARVERDYRSYASTLSLEQPLFDYEAYARYRQGEAQALFADEQFRGRSQELAVRLFAAYSETLFAREQVVLAEAQRRALETQLAFNQRAFEEGEGTRTDLLETRARLSLTRAEEIAAGDRAAAARRTLEAMLGQALEDRELAAPIERFPALRLQPATFEGWRQVALQRSAELGAQRYALEAAAYEVERNRAGHLPRLSLYASSSKTHSASESTYEQKYDTDSVGLRLSLPLFEGGRVSAATRQAGDKYAQAQAELDAQVASVINDSQFDLTASSLAKVRAYEMAVAAAREQVTATRRSVAGGSGSIATCWTPNSSSTAPAVTWRKRATPTSTPGCACASWRGVGRPRPGGTGRLFRRRRRTRAGRRCHQIAIGQRALPWVIACNSCGALVPFSMAMPKRMLSIIRCNCSRSCSCAGRIRRLAATPRSLERVRTMLPSGRSRLRLTRYSAWKASVRSWKGLLSVMADHLNAVVLVGTGCRPESSLSPPGCTLRRRADVYLRTCLGLGLARFGPGGRRLCREKL